MIGQSFVTQFSFGRPFLLQGENILSIQGQVLIINNAGFNASDSSLGGMYTLCNLHPVSTEGVHVIFNDERAKKMRPGVFSGARSLLQITNDYKE